MHLKLCLARDGMVCALSGNEGVYVADLEKNEKVS